MPLLANLIFNIILGQIVKIKSFQLDGSSKKDALHVTSKLSLQYESGGAGTSLIQKIKDLTRMDVYIREFEDIKNPTESIWLNELHMWSGTN